MNIQGQRMDRKNERDIKTLAYVLRRTNYAEADRILNLITPEGKISVMAKGVRKAKSKMAGSVEMFTRSQVNVHYGRGSLATLTGAKMEKFHAGILKDYDKMELAFEILKMTERAAEGISEPLYFNLVDVCLTQLDAGMESRLVMTWFLLNIARAMGEEVNFYRDVDGKKLESGMRYVWDDNEMAFKPDENGGVDEDAIKILRLMVTTDLAVVGRIRGIDNYLPELYRIGKVFREVVK